MWPRNKQQLQHGYRKLHWTSSLPYIYNIGSWKSNIPELKLLLIFPTQTLIWLVLPNFLYTNIYTTIYTYTYIKVIAPDIPLLHPPPSPPPPLLYQAIFLEGLGRLEYAIGPNAICSYQINVCFHTNIDRDIIYATRWKWKYAETTVLTLCC